MKRNLDEYLAAALVLACLGLLLLIANSDAHVRADTTPRVTATSYCLRGRMADGTTTRPRSAASNTLPLGTKIRLTRQAGPGGQRLYVIRDRIGHGTALDLWTSSCGQAIRFGRRNVTYRIGWKP